MVDLAAMFICMNDLIMYPLITCFVILQKRLGMMYISQKNELNE